jgi:hypothetical protein
MKQEEEIQVLWKKMAVGQAAIATGLARSGIDKPTAFLKQSFQSIKIRLLGFCNEWLQ